LAGNVKDVLARVAADVSLYIATSEREPKFKSEEAHQKRVADQPNP
jgi:hypothetical protein